jgi:hypothetical protein
VHAGINNQHRLLVKLRHRNSVRKHGKQERKQHEEQARYQAALTSENAGHLAAFQLGLNRSARQRVPSFGIKWNDAGRQRVLGRDARICTTWNFAALLEEILDVMESLIKELPRLISLQNQLRALVCRNWYHCSIAYGIAVPSAPNPEHSQMLHH